MIDLGECFDCDKNATRAVYDGIGLLANCTRFYMCKKCAKKYIKKRKREKKNEMST